MRKKLILLLVIVGCLNSVNAEQLVLSDVIQQARDAQRMQDSKQKAEHAMTKPASTQCVEDKCNSNEKTAAEKINIGEYCNKTVE